MLTHILVPLVSVRLGSTRLADCVWWHTVAIAQAVGAQVSLLHVLDQRSTADQGAPVDPLDWHLKKTEAESYLNTMKSLLEPYQLSIQSALLEGPTLEQSVVFIQNSGIDLVILCGLDQDGPYGWNTSAFVQQILQRTAASILIVRPVQRMGDQQAESGAEPLRYRRLLVPLDGSKRAESALPVATSLAQANGAEITLVHVVSRPETARRTPLTDEDAELINRLTERNQEEGNRYLQQLQAQMPGSVQIRLVVSNNVVTAIQDTVEQEQSDLLILSAHGYSGEPRWPYGSITNRFLVDTSVPLLVVQDLLRVSTEFVPSDVATRLPGR